MRRHRHGGYISTVLTSSALLAFFSGCQPADGPSGGDAPAAFTSATGTEMVLLAAGGFEMGSDNPDEPDQRPHRVWVDSFYMDRHEVTQEEYEKLMGANPARFKGDQNPVEQIRWKQAIEFCNARSRFEGRRPAYDVASGQCDFQSDGYRLPTEAEWEYAARAGSTTAYSFGDGPGELKRFGWFRDNSLRGPHAVSAKEPNAWGLYDLYGNIWEWCHDFYAEDYYQASPEKNPRGPEGGENRVVRGGCWNSRGEECSSTYRNYENPGYTDTCFGKDTQGFIGFRCVRRAE